MWSKILTTTDKNKFNTLDKKIAKMPDQQKNGEQHQENALGKSTHLNKNQWTSETI